MFDYTIGIPARNESKTIYQMLDSLNADLSIQPVRGTIETVICVNGTSDNTLKKILIAQQDFPNINIQVVESKPGLLLAQRKIIHESNSKANFVLFYNADIRINLGTTRRIIKYLNEHPEAHAVSGDQTPLKIPGVKYAILNIEALHPELFRHPRKYLIGRCFGIRKTSYYVPERFLSDDMFLSNNLVLLHGPSAVQMVPNASVVYIGPQTFKDYFRKIKRYSDELEKLYKSHPKFIALKAYFNRQPDSDLVNHLSIYEKNLLFAHDIIKYVFKKVARISLTPTWVPLMTTKDRKLYE